MQLMLPNRIAVVKLPPCCGACSILLNNRMAHILLVEDGTQYRDLGIRLLTSLGHTVTAVIDAESALHHIVSGAVVDILFTDILLPGALNGLELAANVRQQYPMIKILLTSGAVSSHAEEVARLADGIIGKP